MKIYNTKISVPMKYDRIFHVVPFRCVLVLSLVFIFLSDCHDPRENSVPTKNTPCVIILARNERKKEEKTNNNTE